MQPIYLNHKKRLKHKVKKYRIQVLFLVCIWYHRTRAHWLWSVRLISVSSINWHLCKLLLIDLGIRYQGLICYPVGMGLWSRCLILKIVLIIWTNCCLLSLRRNLKWDLTHFHSITKYSSMVYVPETKSSINKKRSLNICKTKLRILCKHNTYPKCQNFYNKKFLWNKN